MRIAPPPPPPKHTGPPDDDRRMLVDEMAPAIGDALLAAVNGKRSLLTLSDDSEAFLAVIPMLGLPVDVAAKAIERWHEWVLSYRPGDQFDPDANR